jgi:outer membrane protein TolC
LIRYYITDRKQLREPLVSAIEAAQALWEAQRELAMARAELGLAWARLHRTTGETP